MKAYAINRIQRPKGASIAAKKVFDIEEKDFNRLLALGAVRKPTPDELAIAKAEAERAGNSFESRGKDAADKPAGTDLNAMTKPQLVALAEAEKIEIDGSANKAVIVAAIEKARDERDPLGV